MERPFSFSFDQCQLKMTWKASFQDLRFGYGAQLFDQKMSVVTYLESSAVKDTLLPFLCHQVSQFRIKDCNKKRDQNGITLMMGFAWYDCGPWSNNDPDMESKINFVYNNGGGANYVPLNEIQTESVLATLYAALIYFDKCTKLD